MQVAVGQVYRRSVVDLAPISDGVPPASAGLPGGVVAVRPLVGRVGVEVALGVALARAVPTPGVVGAVIWVVLVGWLGLTGVTAWVGPFG